MRNALQFIALGFCVFLYYQFAVVDRPDTSNGFVFEARKNPLTDKDISFVVYDRYYNSCSIPCKYYAIRIYPSHVEFNVGSYDDSDFTLTYRLDDNKPVRLTAQSGVSRKSFIVGKKHKRFIESLKNHKQLYIIAHDEILGKWEETINLTGFKNTLLKLNNLKGS